MMAERARMAEHELHRLIYQSRGDRGIVAMLDWLTLQQNTLNDSWMTRSGDDLLQAQGKADIVKKAIGLISKPPLGIPGDINAD